MASRDSRVISIVVGLIVGAIGVGVAWFAFSGDRTEGDGPFAAWTGTATERPDTGVTDIGTRSVTPPPAPDPSLAREKLWEERRGDLGPPPDGFGSHLVRHEKIMHDLFRRHLGDALELCLDDMRRRGEDLDGRLIFNVKGIPRPSMRMRLSLDGIRVASSDSPDGAGRDLPADVYQCMWDTIEAVELPIPVTAVGLFARKRAPELEVAWDVRDESPAGEIDVIDVGTVPEVVDVGVEPGLTADASLPQ